MRVALASLFVLAACAPSTATLAGRIAARELACREPALRLRAIGELVAGSGALRVRLYDAEGCERQRLYLCVDEPSARCVAEIAALPSPAHHPALARMLQLLRTTARARCPESELRVVQESETLFRFEACDGAWLHHCRARGCERL